MNIKHFYFLLSIIILFSCNKEKITLDKGTLLNRYNLPEDSLKHKSIAFILNNIDNKYSDIPIFIDLQTGKEVLFDLASIENDILLKKKIKQFNLKSSFRTVPDTCIVSNEFLLDDIELAFLLWNKYPWANKVPFDVFTNYLLPYKIYGEEPKQWRLYFIQKYQDHVFDILKNPEIDFEINSTNGIYYWFLENHIDSLFIYNNNPFRLTRYPGLNELNAVKSGDCFGESYLLVMVLRSLGIPSTIDYVPFWGSKNGSHTGHVFWNNENKKLTTATGRKFDFPSKVLRYTFKKQNIWTDSILPVIKQSPFMLDYLKHDNWLDVTHEHTKTVTVDYECIFPTDFAYICVFNYGQWIPVYWGKINNGKIRFENMGTKILYRVAIPDNNTFKLISPIFCLDENKNKIFFKPNQNVVENLNLIKINAGTSSWVGAGKTYSLYYYDETNEWTLIKTQKCEKDSIVIFEKIPSKTLYQLLDIEQERRLERIFTYENGKQIWW